MPIMAIAGRNVAGKVALVTGAARGIGAGLAERLADQGARLALVGLEAEEQRKVAERIGGRSWQADVTDWAALEKAVQGVVEHFGAIDIVVANAGIATTGFVRSIDRDAFERVIEVDLLGVWRTFRVTLPHVIAAKGYLLAISSAAAMVHLPGMANYSAAKAGVEAFCNSLRAEVGHLGVKVGVAHPTWIRTDLVECADAHPVFGRVRGGSSSPLGRTYPLSVALDSLEAGIRHRARVIHVPRWVGVLKLFRALFPPVVELGACLRMPRADRAVLDDIAARGARESAVLGHGGRAAMAEPADHRPE